MSSLYCTRDFAPSSKSLSNRKHDAFGMCLFDAKQLYVFTPFIDNAPFRSAPLPCPRGGDAGISYRRVTELNTATEGKARNRTILSVKKKCHREDHLV